MKKLLLSFGCIVMLSLSGSAQTNFVPTPANYDYSRFISDCGTFVTSLVNVIQTNEHTFVHLRLDVRRNGSVNFPSSAYIQGDGFLEKVCGLIDVSDTSTLDLDKYYGIRRKQHIEVALIFRAIPVGVETINYIEPGFINFTNISIYNPDTSIHTDWDEQSLRTWWAKNGISDIEGIYDFWDCNNKEWWGSNKFTVAVKKDDIDYQVVYLSGNQNGTIWKTGDVKAIIKPTAIPNFFKTIWFMDSKRINDNIFVTFDATTMEIKEKEQNINATFLKMFPSANHAKSGTKHNREKQPDNEEIEYRNSGSGIIISTNGVVVTNYHVIEDSKFYDIVVRDGSKVLTYKAKLLATDKVNDLALLMIDDDRFIRFDEIPFTLSSKTSEVGTSVFAMGYPLTSYMGEEVKITDGIISSKTGYEGDIVTYQISAPIQPGNSGGPLFDKRGNLIGITNAGIMEANNVGYAIKASYLRNLIESAPISIEIPQNNILQDLELFE